MRARGAAAPNPAREENLPDPPFLMAVDRSAGANRRGLDCHTAGVMPTQEPVKKNRGNELIWHLQKVARSGSCRA